MPNQHTKEELTEEIEIIDRTVVPNDSALKVVDLFCGAGGLAEGFRMAGFESILGLDNWLPACETFSANHPTALVINGDIDKISAEDVLSIAGLKPGSVNVVCGGPPCQGFSLAGKTLADDPRNFLYKRFLGFVESISPDWVVMENVPSLLDNENVVTAIYNDLGKIESSDGGNYIVSHKVVNAAKYGVPQTRSRVLFVAAKANLIAQKNFDIDEMFEPLFSQIPTLWGTPTFITVEEAISDLPDIYAGEGSEVMPYDKNPNNVYQSLMRGEISLANFFSEKQLKPPSVHSPIMKSEAVLNHKAQNHSDLIVERFKNIPPGGSKKDLAKTRPDLLPPDGHPNQGLTYGRLWSNKPAPTIPANYSRPSGNRSIHPTFPRLITPREAMRLSSFPDCYELKGLMVAQREQVGNAVAPLLAFRVASYIREMYDG